jgi:hypothetical protein
VPAPATLAVTATLPAPAVLTRKIGEAAAAVAQAAPVSAKTTEKARVTTAVS